MANSFLLAVPWRDPVVVSHSSHVDRQGHQCPLPSSRRPCHFVDHRMTVPESCWNFPVPKRKSLGDRVPQRRRLESRAETLCYSGQREGQTVATLVRAKMNQKGRDGYPVCCGQSLIHGDDCGEKVKESFGAEATWNRRFDLCSEHLKSVNPPVDVVASFCRRDDCETDSLWR